MTSELDDVPRSSARDRTEFIDVRVLPMMGFIYVFLDVEEVRWQSSRAGALAVLLRRCAGRVAEQVRWSVACGVSRVSLFRITFSILEPSLRRSSQNRSNHTAPCACVWSFRVGGPSKTRHTAQRYDFGFGAPA